MAVITHKMIVSFKQCSELCKLLTDTPVVIWVAKKYWS